MPYVSQTAREHIDPHVTPLSENIHTAGDLNYAITRLALQFLQSRGLNYSDIAETIGTLHLAASEMERRLVSEYEDSKIEQHGDVPEYASLLLALRLERRKAYDHAPDVAQPHG
jgi:hypothetical protein